MFDRASRPTITESVVESADSAVESADYWSRPTGNWPSGYGPLVSNAKAASAYPFAIRCEYISAIACLPAGLSNIHESSSDSDPCMLIQNP